MATRKLFRRRAGMLHAGAIAIALSVGITVGVPQPDASAAVSERRFQMPVVGGSALHFAQGDFCTAGVVLKANGLFQALTPYQRAVRYVVTAGHCGHVGQSVSLEGPPRGSLGHHVGNVVWKSRTADLLMIRVEPVGQTRLDCPGGTSAGLGNCRVSSIYAPRALGRAIGPGGTLPVSAQHIATAGEFLCPSGARSGYRCDFYFIPSHSEVRASLNLGVARLDTVRPGGPGNTGQGEPGARVPGDNVRPPGENGTLPDGNGWPRGMTVPGDSGAPVLSTSGRIVGIHSAVGPAGSPQRDLIYYTAIAQVFREHPGDYVLAPPN